MLLTMIFIVALLVHSVVTTLKPEYAKPTVIKLPTKDHRNAPNCDDFMIKITLPSFLNSHDLAVGPYTNFSVVRPMQVSYVLVLLSQPSERSEWWR